MLSTTRIRYGRPRQVDTREHKRGSGRAYDPGVSTPRSRPALPFDAKTIGEEIERERVRLGIRVEDIGPKAGLNTRTHWYSKVNGTRPFRWEEAARIALEFQAPPGWPIVPRREGIAWQAWLEDRDKHSVRDE